MTNTPPSSRTLFLWSLSLILFLLTCHVRKTSSRHSILLTTAFAVPTITALVLLFTFISPDTYNGKDRADTLLDHFRNGFYISDSISGSGTRSANSVDLSNLGDRKELDPIKKLYPPPEVKGYSFALSSEITRPSTKQEFRSRQGTVQ